MDNDQMVERLLSLVAAARREGWYEDDPSWDEVDELLRALGHDVPRSLRSQLSSR